MTIQISYRLDWICFAIDFNFVRFHDFLNRFPHFTQEHINTRSLNNTQSSYNYIIFHWWEITLDQKVT